MYLSNNKTYLLYFFYTVECTVDGFDVVIALDISMSVSQSQFVNLRRFVVRVVETLDIGPQQSLVGVIFFARDSRFVINLNDFNDKARLVEAIKDLRLRTERGTRFTPVLNLLEVSANNESLGFRPDFPNVAVIVTDGRANDNQARLNSTARNFHRSADFIVYAVGVEGNNGANLMELEVISGNPETAFLIGDLNNQDSFENLEQALIEQLCAPQSKDNLYV